MGRSTKRSAATAPGTARGLRRRLRARRPEIEEAVFAGVRALAEPPGGIGPDGTEGLRGAVTAAVGYGLDALERGDERSPDPPLRLLAGARAAARSGVSLGAMLRLYFAGHSLLADFVIEEAGRPPLSAAALQRLLAAQATVLDRLLPSLSQEHARAARQQSLSPELRRALRIERLLAGELLDTSQIAYSFAGYHVAMIARGEAVAEAIRELATELDRSLLVLRRDGGVLWVWLGGRRPFAQRELKDRATCLLSEGTHLAIGEPATGMEGWRRSHRQAQAALPIAFGGPAGIVGYADVALLALSLEDELLAASLRQLYLVPLEEERDGGEMLRETLRAYFAAEGNVSSAAAALGVKRHTVTTRLRAVEHCLGRRIGTCVAELEVVLRLDDLTSGAAPRKLARGS